MPHDSDVNVGVAFAALGTTQLYARRSRWGRGAPRRSRQRGPGRPVAAWLAWLAWLAVVAACSNAAPDPPATRGQDVLGGLRATATELDHTGALVALDPGTGSPVEVCTATLIAPETLVTAKHCAALLPLAELEGLSLGWGSGPEARAPEELISIVAAQTAPGDIGGFVGVGRDVATLHLDHPSPIEPATPALFDDGLLGAALVSIGYGAFDARGAADGRRRIGRETVAATSGRALEALLGSFEGFVEWSLTGDVTAEDILSTSPPGDTVTAALREQFEALLLYDRHEAATGLAATDTQTCSGDSGGPLARFTPEQGWLTYGVVSGGLSSRREACDFGSIFATFGPESFAFLEQARRWRDPCGDVTTRGECAGSVARICQTSFHGNIRRLVERDCAASGSACVSTGDGTGCGQVPAPVPAAAGAPRALLEAARSAFFPRLGRAVRWRP